MCIASHHFGQARAVPASRALPAIAEHRNVRLRRFCTVSFMRRLLVDVGEKGTYDIIRNCMAQRIQLLFDSFKGHVHRDAAS